jgi:acetyl-CoA synthetase
MIDCLFIVICFADVINVSGHRLGTAEVESALALHKDVVEAAVVGFPHPIKVRHYIVNTLSLLPDAVHLNVYVQGEGIYAFVTLRNGAHYSPAIEKELIGIVRKQIGPIANPDAIHVTPDLPKTRSGKIMRRILRKVAAGDTDTSKFGDMSTLADPSVVTALIESRSKFIKK